MKIYSRSLKAFFHAMLFLTGLGLWGCDEFEEDIMPIKFADIRIHSDDIYLYRTTSKLRLDHFVNDTLVTYENITYSAPLHGELLTNYDGERVMGYKPDPDFVGTDSVTYRVCAGQTCKTATIRLHVEELLDPSNCTTILVADSLETTMNTPKEIRYLLNDILCPGSYDALETRSPQRGTARTYQYSGSFKNDVYVYYPPKDYVGTDSFVYRVYPRGTYPNGAYMEVEVKIKIK